MAGPIIRAALKEVEFSATALDRSASPTSSATKVARRRVERGDAAEQKRERVDVPQLHQSADGEDTEAEGESAHRRLGADQQLSPVEMIGRKTGQRQQQQMGSELQRHHNAHGGGVVVGELGEHQPTLGDALHPCSHIGYDRAGGPQPIVVAAQRTKGTRHRTSRESPGELPP
jgi:hypothetical protein